MCSCMMHSMQTCFSTNFSHNSVPWNRISYWISSFMRTFYLILRFIKAIERRNEI